MCAVLVGSRAMTGDTALVDRFEEQRPRLRRLAYGMLGNHSDADEAIQETWIRLDAADASSIDNLGGWLTTVTGRISLDMIRSRSRHPMPLADSEDADQSVAAVGSPEVEAVMAESVSRALRVALATLTPAERLTFVLHDLFAVPFDDIAGVLERSPAAAKMLASRARHKVRGEPVSEPHSSREHEVIVAAFLDAARSGNLMGLVAVLHPDVVMHSDRRAIAMGSPGTVGGAENVAAVFSGRALGAEAAFIDTVAGLAWIVSDQAKVAWEFTIEIGQIVRIDMVADSDALADAEIHLLS